MNFTEATEQELHMSDLFLASNEKGPRNYGLVHLTNEFVALSFADIVCSSTIVRVFPSVQQYSEECSAKRRRMDGGGGGDNNTASNSSSSGSSSSSRGDNAVVAEKPTDFTIDLELNRFRKMQSNIVISTAATAALADEQEEIDEVEE